MKIIVVDLAKRRISSVIAGILIIALVAITCTIGVVTQVYGEELTIASADSIPYEKIIILDPGHGGEDPGAVGVNGTLEKDLNLEIALEMGKILEEKGYIVIYTRTDDRLLYTEEEDIKGIRKISDLKNRCKVAEKYPESVFVSIHMNSFGNSRYSGLQVYYSDKSEQSKALASKIQSSVSETLQKDNTRKIKSGKGMYILDNVSNDVVLVECGFLTNKAECEKLSEKEYQKELSFSIVCGIIEYIEENRQ